MKRLKICLVHEEYPEETNFGGIATYEKIMAEEYVKLGYEVYVICRGLKKYREYEENGVKIFRIFVKTTNDQVANYTKYRKLVSDKLLYLQNEIGIDIIEVPDWGAETILFEGKRTVPIVVRLHTPLKVWLKYNKNSFGKVKSKLLKWESEMIKNANLITCCSEALKKIIVKDFNISSSRILVTPNPANIYNFYRDSAIKKSDSLLFVGSLEERKGVCVLAKSLNMVFKKYPNLKIKLIGKDTNRNKRNISTKELVYKTVNNKYSKNLKFLGQIPNTELNTHLNSARVAIFPSLFDNFPYVVLESMATGLQIVGSRNSGMVEMLDDESSIYETGDHKDLAKKIIEKYELSLKEEINESNINRLKSMYNPENVAFKMIEVYNQAIKEFNDKTIDIKNLEFVLSKVTDKNRIVAFEREKEGVANYVFKVTTPEDNYIIKKYIYNYDFELINELYQLYNSAGIKVIKPINEIIIKHQGYNYNVFKYIDSDRAKKDININYLGSILCCDRKTTQNSTILNKTLKYYDNLRKIKDYGIIQQDVEVVLNLFEELKDMKILNEQYLNHGDISLSNILISDKTNYIIDFDEATVTTPLYDFAVVIIKMFTSNTTVDIKAYKRIRKLMKSKYKDYSNKDFKNILSFYLCKILLEKFYFHYEGQINIFSKRQQKDNYKRYMTILKKNMELKI